jgi:hypothetical protein
VTAAQKVVLYEEDPGDPNGKRFVGSAIWRTAMVTVVPGQPPELVIHADIEVPERKLAMMWSRRNTEKGLPAPIRSRSRFCCRGIFPPAASPSARHSDEAGRVDTLKTLCVRRGRLGPLLSGSASEESCW